MNAVQRPSSPPSERTAVRERAFVFGEPKQLFGILTEPTQVVAGRPAVLLSGDLALLHDVGAFVTASRARVSLTVVAVNNDGGGIFSFLPIAQAAKQDEFETLFGTPHGVDLAHAAALGGARLHRPETPAALRGAVRQGLEGGLHLVEVRVDRAANVDEHRQLFARMAAALGDGPWA